MKSKLNFCIVLLMSIAALFFVSSKLISSAITCIYGPGGVVQCGGGAGSCSCDCDSNDNATDWKPGTCQNLASCSGWCCVVDCNSVPPPPPCNKICQPLTAVCDPSRDQSSKDLGLGPAINFCNDDGCSFTKTCCNNGQTCGPDPDGGDTCIVPPPPPNPPNPPPPNPCGSLNVCYNSANTSHVCCAGACCNDGTAKCQCANNSLQCCTPLSSGLCTVAECSQPPPPPPPPPSSTCPNICDNSRCTKPNGVTGRCSRPERDGCKCD